MTSQRNTKWTERARKDLYSLVDYIARDNEQAANDLLQVVEETIYHLALSPIGRRGETAGTYEKVLSRYPSYMVIYKVSDSSLQVLRIFHTAQKSKA
ncbi:type II toxin-antitoxin system mRNA interferase toxin, RelE/StbE family (plasmid) [Deltaproteobacteria bacterium Smac51]|nr:type II toxin-antitoxin system mRNA interferase toxin, RelE/StbE family [Deltaproteobacteria bacterium Smac51]